VKIPDEGTSDNLKWMGQDFLTNEIILDIDLFVYFGRKPYKYVS